MCKRAISTFSFGVVREVTLRWQVMNGPVQHPGIAQGRTADHHPVATGFVQHPFRILGGLDVPVADHGDASLLLSLVE